MLFGLAGLPVRGSAQKAPPAAPQNGVKRETIGDIKISGKYRISVQSDFSKGKITGKDTVIEVPDRASKSMLVVHADEITFANINNPGTGHLEMNGRLSYTLTQQTPEGPRVLKGTAGSGTFRRETKHIDLSGGVQANLTDPRLEGPGILHSGAVTIDTSAVPYRYTLEGSPDVNDIRFTSVPAKPKEKSSPSNPESQIGPVHIHHFSTGEFQVGKTARFDGVQSVADLLSRTGKSQGTFRARRLQAAFAGTGGLTRAEAVGTVHYHVERPAVRKSADGKTIQGRQEITGTCDDASYELEGAQITLNGSVDATLTDTLTLMEPAKLLASRVVVTDTKTLRYTLTGAPNRRRLQFTPRPAEPVTAPAADPAAKPVPPPPPVFALGTVTLVGFQTGVYEPGKKVEVTAEDKQDLTLDTTDAKTMSSSHIQTHKFTAALEPAGTITQAESDGPVTFHIQQLAPPKIEKGAAAAKPDPKNAKQKPRVLQAMDGAAGQAVFVKKNDQRTITLQGPFNAKVTDPENLVGPGVATGAKGDTLSLDLLTRSLDLDNASATGTLIFQPRSHEQDADKQPPGGK